MDKVERKEIKGNNEANLRIIGTSHIAKESLNEVKDAFDNFKPEIATVELDNQRLRALMAPERKRTVKIDWKTLKRIGLKGLLFALIGAYAENKLGKLVGVAPGEEMKTAIKLAQEKGAKVVPIDQNINITLGKISKRMSWRERFNFVKEIFRGIFYYIFKRKVPPEWAFDLRKVPEKKIIEKLTEKMKEEYPNLYEILVVERNRYMARKIVKLIKENPDKRVLAVVGAGHEQGLKEMLKRMEAV